VAKEPARPRPHAPVTREAPTSAGAEAKRMLVEASQALQGRQYAQAEALYNQVRSMKVDTGAATTGLAMVAFQRGNFSEAARIGKRATESGGGVPARMVLGNSLFKLGRYDEAIVQYQEVLKVDHGHAEAKTNLKAALARKDG
jgi:tetratricopeptide (TPR) repeat protein